MRTMLVVPSALLALGLGSGAMAQQPPESSPREPDKQDKKVDVDQLPLNLNRVQRQLQQSGERQDGSGLNLRFFIAVYAAAPSIQLFTQQDNLTRGPAPYGAPTHSEMMQITIPQEYRAPAADFSALVKWLGDKGKK
jgi:hypothetical protein